MNGFFRATPMRDRRLPTVQAEAEPQIGMECQLPKHEERPMSRRNQFFLFAILSFALSTPVGAGGLPTYVGVREDPNQIIRFPSN